MADGLFGYQRPRTKPGYSGLRRDVGTPQAGLSSYEPTLRDKAAALMYDRLGMSSNVTEGLMGSTGLGVSHPTGLGLIDLTPLGAPFWLNEAERAKQAQSGGVFSGMLDTAGAIPVPGAKAASSAIKGGMSKVDDVATFAKRVEDDLGLRSLHMFETQSGDLKLNMIAVPKGKQGKGIGSEAMRRLAEYADQRGLRLTLTTGVKDDGFGTTSPARLKRFYKKFGFVENKGRNKDFSISENMYRQPGSGTKAEAGQ